MILLVGYIGGAIIEFVGVGAWVGL